MLFIYIYYISILVSAMSNIFNHNREIFQILINKDNYWDFHLATDYRGGNSLYNGLTTHCLSSFIDTNNPNCVWFGKLYSDEQYQWENAINNGVELNSIGYTGVDNGIVKFEKDAISNREFLKLYTHSSLKINKDDFRFTLNKVDGNNQIYDYTNDIVEKDNMIVSRLNGGFYQGFFKTKCNEYQVLPSNIDDGLTVELLLNKCDFKNDKPTLNITHNGNEGFFFYIGTREENKWWKYYKVSAQFDESCNAYNKDGYFSSEYFEKDNYPTNYSKEEDYLIDNEYADFGKPCCDYYKNRNNTLPTDYVNYNVKDTYIIGGYLQEDEPIYEDMDFNTEEGYNLYQPNIVEVKTDNKFITFNRTGEGFDINSEGKNDSIILYDIKVPEIENYFTLFNRTKNGYTIDNIDKLIAEESKKYNVINDITSNALGFRITEDGKLGYRYLISDCDAESGYSIVEEYTKDKVVNNQEWYCITVVINRLGNSKMNLSFYCNGKLKLISQELPILDLRGLNDLYSKQESVPYNISIGGGTQGLCDVIYHNFRDLPSYVLPLEKHFAGTFIGYIKEFRLYDCSLSKNEIDNNVNYSFSKLLHK